MFFFKLHEAGVSSLPPRLAARDLGALQWFAGIGLLAGMIQPWMGQLAAGGLALMMLIAVIVRIQIKDTLLQTIPAVFYLALNTYLCIAGF